ncbi:hypothetical protein B7494_g3743 [Chlorociboria aeruginascens]|nr:hypothetical protein B7494_g3743 [Chlorociboria aeruginascens]
MSGVGFPGPRPAYLPRGSYGKSHSTGTRAGRRDRSKGQGGDGNERKHKRRCKIEKFCIDDVLPRHQAPCLRVELQEPLPPQSATISGCPAWQVAIRPDQSVHVRELYLLAQYQSLVATCKEACVRKLALKSDGRALRITHPSLERAFVIATRNTSDTSDTAIQRYCPYILYLPAILSVPIPTSIRRQLRHHSPLIQSVPRYIDRDVLERHTLQNPGNHHRPSPPPPPPPPLLPVLFNFFIIYSGAAFCPPVRLYTGSISPATPTPKTIDPPPSSPSPRSSFAFIHLTPGRTVSPARTVVPHKASLSSSTCPTPTVGHHSRAEPNRVQHPSPTSFELRLQQSYRGFFLGHSSGYFPLSR